MAWNDNNGILILNEISEHELWMLLSRFMSSNIKKTSSYKYGFLKSILDNLILAVNTPKGMELTFDMLFSKFAENYWNLIVKYNICQLRYNGKSDKSKLEQIFNRSVERSNSVKLIDFEAIEVNEKKQIIKDVKTACKRNVIGAMYEDFDGKLYGFDIKKERIWIGHDAYEFLLRYKLLIEKMNYYEWAKFLEKINDKQNTIELIDKLESATPKRKSLNIYRDILYFEFEERNCFYCGKTLEKIDVDHVIPWSLIHEDKVWNFVLTCPSCNKKKNSKIPNKESLVRLIERNKIFSETQNEFVKEEFQNYSEKLVEKLWEYAKANGYKEYNNREYQPITIGCVDEGMSKEESYVTISCSSEKEAASICVGFKIDSNEMELDDKFEIDVLLMEECFWENYHEFESGIFKIKQINENNEHSNLRKACTEVFGVFSVELEINDEKVMPEQSLVSKIEEAMYTILESAI